MVDPYPAYARLRDSSPVRRSPLGFWVFTDHADCLQILRERGVSSETRSRNERRTKGRDVGTVAVSEMFQELIALRGLASLPVALTPA